MSMQEKIMQYQELQQNLQMLEQYKQGVLSALQEISSTQETLKELQKAKNEDEVLFPIGSGILVPGKLNNSKEALTSIGSKTLVMKTLDESTNFLQKRREEQEEILVNLDRQIQEQYSNVQKIMTEVQELQKKRD